MAILQELGRRAPGILPPLLGALAFSYFFLTAFFIAVGTTAVLPAALAAWAPNILFMAGATYLMLTVRT